MRALLVTFALLAVGWSGCLEAPATLGLFGFLPIERDQATLESGHGCDDLERILDERALSEARVALDQSVLGQGGWHLGGGGSVAVDFAMADSAAPQAAAGAAHSYSTKGAQATGTNNQEAGADEGDIVKTDGQWTYVLSGRYLHVLRSPTIGDLELVGRLDVGDGWGGELLLEHRGDGAADDRLLVARADWGNSPGTQALLGMARGTEPGYGYAQFTRVTILSLADRAAPRVEREFLVEGSLAGSRLVGGVAHVIVQKWASDLGLQAYAYPSEDELRSRGLDWESYERLPEATRTGILKQVALDADARNQRVLAEAGLASHLPVVGERIVGDAHLPALLDEAACRSVLVPPQSTSRAVTTVLSIDVAEAGLPDRTVQVLGGSDILYASPEALVLASPAQDMWWFYVQPDLEEATDLHWFDLDGLDVRHRASGRVAGIVQDSFGLDVHDGTLRVATTTGTWGRWWVPEGERLPMLNHLATFRAEAGLLVPTGIVGGIAPGERIWSARFTDTRAYLVTFRNIDPLWVIDLTGAPTVLGELEIPGVSTYIHPIDDGTLLTIGFGADEEDVMRRDQVEISLFDVSDPSQPRRAAVLDLTPGGDGWSWSSALHEHKAFTYWDAVGTLAVPLSTAREVRSGFGGEYQYVHRAGLKLVTVDADAKTLALRGEVDQDMIPATRDYGAEVERSFFVGFPELGVASVYAVGPMGVTTHDLATLEAQDAVAFEP